MSSRHPLLYMLEFSNGCHGCFSHNESLPRPYSIYLQLGL